ncbi:MAG TPA: sulfatase [Polyangiaceae bacterium]|nr:sulfatase [Polyangiaceae bacterium]
MSLAPCLHDRDELADTMPGRTGIGARAVWLRIARSAGAGARLGAGVAIGGWSGDALVLAASHGGATLSQWLTGIGAALFVALTTALVAGAMLGAVFWPAAAHGVAASRRRWAALRQQGPHALLAAGLCLLFVSSLGSWVAYRAILDIELDFARPDTTAAALTAFAWAFALALALALPACHRVARALTVRAVRARGARRLVSLAWPVAAAAAVAAVAFGTGRFLGELARAAMQWQWRELVPVVGAIAGLVVAVRWPEARRPWALRARRAATLAALFACGAACTAAWRLRPESSTARSIAFVRALSGRAGHAAWTAALDFDGDGQLGVLGGGDCAPFDPRRYTGAVDVPGNGVDEDCDGMDAAPVPIRPRPRMAVGQNALPRRPTIVLVTIDGLGAPRLAAVGPGPKSIMPHLDELASRSMLFTRCFSQGPSTRLSFPSMFTSRYDSELVFQAGPTHPYSLAPSERQLQDVLDDAGYETVAVIPQDYFDRTRWASVTRGFQRLDRSALPFGLHNAPQVTDAALRVLSQQRDQPLYLWVHYYDAHAPYVRVPGMQYPDETDESLYDGALKYIDGELQRIIAAVDQRPEPTYLFVTADHSTVFHPDPASRRAHYGFDLYTATLHVPLVVHGPGVRTGRNDALVSTMDVAPTIADLLRLDAPRLEGTSLAPELLTGGADPRRTIFHEFYLQERLLHGYEPLEIVSLHSGRYNLVLDRVRGTYELYDFERDYFEQQDLYEEEVRSPEVARMRTLLGAFVASADSGDHALAEQTADRVFRQADR